MKVAHINVTCGKGSTGVIVVEISERLKEKGHQSFIAYGLDKSDYPNSFKIGSKLEAKLHSSILELWVKRAQDLFVRPRSW